MKRSCGRSPFWALLFLVWVAGCTSMPTPPPVATLTPHPTATPLPTSTPLPPPTDTPPPSPTPTPSAGYYRNADLGMWFLYPEDWLREETDEDMPAVIITDNNDPVRLLAGGRTVEGDVAPLDFARTISAELDLAETVELVADGPATVADDRPAWEVTLAWEDEDGHAYQAQGYVVVSGGYGYILLMTAHPEVLAARSNTLQAIGRTLHIER